MIETIFEALTGLRFSLINIIGLFAFYGGGVLFGRLTRNVGILKLLLAAIIAYYGFTFLANASGAFIIAFIIGLATNHISFTMEAIYWAEDISDFLYALRHPGAFEDIRDAEQGESYGHDENQQSWRSEEAGPDWSKSQNRTDGSTTDHTESLADKYFRILGLNPTATYDKAELKKAYRKQAFKKHPDAGGSTHAFQELGSAYEWLQKYHANC